MIPAIPACLILEISALMAVATIVKSRNIEPPKTAIPAKIGISDIPFLSPKNASPNPINMAIAAPGILPRKRFFEIQNDNSIINPTNRNANISPFISIIFSSISIFIF